MARSKQQRTPTQSRSTTAGTPGTAVSPVFSNKTSIQPTPETSDIDEDIPKSAERPKRVTRASSGKVNKASKKRSITSDTQLESDVEEDTSARPKKRRAVTYNAYVEIPVKITVCTILHIV